MAKYCKKTRLVRSPVLLLSTEDGEEKAKSGQAIECIDLLDDDLLVTDLSAGKAPQLVPVYNEVDDERIPADFTYTPSSEYIPPLVLSREDKTGCKCVDGKCESDSCPCVSRSTIRFVPGQTGRLPLDYNFYRSAFFECSPESCGCKGNCAQRLHQDKGRVGPRVEIFRTQKKGFACRLARGEIVERGTFVGEFAGEVIDEEEEDRRDPEELSEYSMKLQLDSECTLTVDPIRRGNFMRFSAHSCNPNLQGFLFYSKHRHMDKPSLGYLALRDIYGGEELTIDYGEDWWVQFERSFSCECGYLYCRYRRAGRKRKMTRAQEVDEKRRKQERNNFYDRQAKKRRGPAILGEEDYVLIDD